MNSTSQLGIHPGAESLNAFVEQALPEPEREQVLAHLAECGRCRQVVYLAQVAVGKVETTGALSSEATAVEPVGTRIRSWFKGWRIAWVPAVALAAIFGVAVVVQFRHGEPDLKSGPGSEQEIAKVEPEPKIQAQGGKGGGDSTGAPPASSASDKPLEKKTLSAKAPIESKAITAPAPSATAPQAEIGASEVANDRLDGAVSRPRAEFHGPALQSPSAHGGPAPQMQQSWNGSQQAGPPPQVPTASTSGSFLSTVTTNSVQVSSDSALDQAKSSSALPRIELEKSPGKKEAPRASFAAATPVAGFARKVTSMNLPSGLGVKSIATGLHRTLAIDAAGAVFLREDAETNWVTLAPSWTGRAILVRFRETVPNASGSMQAGKNVGGPVSKSNGTDGFSAGVVSGIVAPAGVFEIETDSGKTWISADGNEWKAK
ncbi:MAG: zf-HC2 domain-containing protein [Terracidiphilus sp.]|jgi:hypothetical protein